MPEPLRPDESGADGIFLSMIVPTRGRPDGMRRLLDSIAAHTRRPEQVEIVMVIDDDDEASLEVKRDDLKLEVIKVSPGRTMGELIMAGARRTRGRYLMLLNDDVCIETPGWDDLVRSVLSSQPDDIVLIHVNDTIFGRQLCTFPMVSRTFCDMSSGITDERYRRYCIDDAIFNTFNLLACLGHRRIIYLPDIIFRHENFTLDANGVSVYTPIPEIRVEDARLLAEMQPKRNETAVRLAGHIEALARRNLDQDRRNDLRFLSDVAALRRPELSRCIISGAADLDACTTVVVFFENVRSPSAQACLEALGVHTPRAEIIALSCSLAGRAQCLNRLIGTCTTDYLVVVDETVRVGAGWLRQLLGRMKHDVAIVGGSVGNSGNHWSDALLLLDVAKCKSLRIDESFPLFFYDLDLRLRALEQSFQLAHEACAGRMRALGGIRDHDDTMLLEDEAVRWTGKWIDGGRLARLGPDIAREVSCIVDFARFPSIVEELLAGEGTVQHAAAYGASVRARLRPLAGRPRLARGFWTALEVELQRRHDAFMTKGALGRRSRLLGSLGKAWPLPALAYRMRAGARVQAGATQHYVATSVPPSVQREVGKLCSTFGLRTLGSSLWNSAQALERSRQSIKDAQPQQ